MSKIALLILAAVAAFAADDPWTKVKEIKSGAEVRVFKKGSMQPVVAKMDEATDDHLTVVVKNEQVAIAKEQIDRVDARPAAKTKPTTETKTTTTDPDYRPAPQGYGSRSPGTSTSTSVSLGSKPDFETVYRRPATPPKKESK